MYNANSNLIYMTSSMIAKLIYISFNFFYKCVPTIKYFDIQIYYIIKIHIINKYDYILFKFNFYNPKVMWYKISIMKNMLTFICIIFTEMLIHNSYI